MSVIVHQQVYRVGVFGGAVNTSLCARLRTQSDGMNLTIDPSRVTCKFCLRKMLPRPTKIPGKNP